MHRTRTSLTSIALAAALALSACGGTSTTAASPADTEPAAASVVAAEPTALPVQAEVPAPAADQQESVEPTEAPSTGGTIEINFSDGREWSMPTSTCQSNPESSHGIFFMDGEGEDGTKLNVIETWPLDGDQTNGTSFIATFIDEAGELYQLEAATIEETAGGLSFKTGVHQGLWGNEPADFTGWFSCTP